MGPLTIQIMILVASFLFYRILKSGFDSWKAVLIDFGIVAFLFGLQYYLQKNQKNNSEDQTMFPAGPLSTFFGTSFPSKIAMDELLPSITPRPVEVLKYGCYLQLKDHLFMDPKQKKILHFDNKMEDRVKFVNEGKDHHSICPMYGNHKLHIKESGFYMVQMSCDVDQVPYSAKLSLKGSKNQIEIELENLKNNIMIQDTTTLYLIKL
jgi:hypothetical protein